jgi:hypothetical protein
MVVLLLMMQRDGVSKRRKKRTAGAVADKGQRRMSEALFSFSSAQGTFALDRLSRVGKVRYVAETKECWWLVRAMSRLGFTVRASSPFIRNGLVQPSLVQVS